MTVYRFFCDQCNYNKYTSNLSEFVEAPRSKIMKNTPQWDAEKKKKADTTFMSLPKKYKCPQCGRLISPKKTTITDVSFQPPFNENET